MEPGGFQFGEASEEAVTQAAVALPQSEAWIGVAGCWAGLILLVYLTVRLSTRGGSGRPLPTLRELPPAIRCLALMAFVSLSAVQVLGAATAYLQTRVVNESLIAYFQYLSWAKMLGISHSHVFGFFVVYAALGMLLAVSEASERTKCYLISFALWAGLFDVGSWWLIKKYSATFEFVSIAAASASGIVTLVTFYYLLRSFKEAFRHAG